MKDIKEGTYFIYLKVIGVHKIIGTWHFTYLKSYLTFLSFQLITIFLLSAKIKSTIIPLEFTKLTTSMSGTIQNDLKGENKYFLLD